MSAIKFGVVPNSLAKKAINDWLEEAMERFIHVIEIPVTDIKRAIRFYSAIFDGLEFKEEEEGFVKYALFLTDDMCDNGILLVQGEQYKPSVDGPLIYLNGGDDVSEVLSKVLEA